MAARAKRRKRLHSSKRRTAAARREQKYNKTRRDNVDGATRLWTASSAPTTSSTVDWPNCPESEPSSGRMSEAGGRQIGARASSTPSRPDGRHAAAGKTASSPLSQRRTEPGSTDGRCERVGPGPGPQEGGAPPPGSSSNRRRGRAPGQGDRCRARNAAREATRRRKKEFVEISFDQPNEENEAMAQRLRRRTRGRAARDRRRAAELARGRRPPDRP